MRNKAFFRANCSGQLLIVAALAIAILISSTTIYVYELSGERQNGEDFFISDFVFAVKQGSRNAVISALANASNGGEKTILADNLNSLSQAYIRLNQRGIWRLSYTVRDNANYEGGIWLSWGTNGLGVSSAYANFTLAVYDLTFNVTMHYAVNITTAITVNGYYTTNGTAKTVSLYCQVFNEGEPALAKRLTVFYENLGVWVPVNASNSLSITDYGNGTYALSFTVNVPSEIVQILVHVEDLRGILVQAGLSCREG
ncbi:MAG: hypothetical protein ACPLKQ_06815 [Candidatus Bathyarchaeales archaeon]